MPMRPQFRLLSLALLFAGLLAGCTSETVAPPDPAVVERLETMDAGPMRAAWARLETARAMRYRHVTFRRGDGRYRVASIARIEAGDERIVWSDTAGTRPDATGAGLAADPDAPRDPVPHLLGDDPSYLQPRNYEYFTYRLLAPDTLSGRRVEVVEVRRRAGTGDAQPLRRARFYLDEGVLVGLDLQRASEGPLFDETLRASLRLRPAGGVWMPFTSDVASRVDLPLGVPLFVRTQTAYYGFDDSSAQTR